MSNPNEKDKKLDLIKENFNHARQIENERLQFAQIMVQSWRVLLLYLQQEAYQFNYTTYY